MIKCPCKECISFAICISKKAVKCDDFNEYTTNIGANYASTNGPPYDIDDYWKLVNSILPKLKTIYGEDND